MLEISGIHDLKSALPSLKKVLVLMGQTPNLDSAAASLGIAVALQHAGHDVQVACEADMRVEFSRLVGVDQVKKRIANRNLVVSFDYSEERVEKVSYNISDDGKRFHLVISPRTGGSALDPDSVKFDLAGVEADLVIMVGVSSFAELGVFYEQERNSIESAFTVALTLFPADTFAKLHVDGRGATGLAETAAAFLVSLGISMETDSASNLLYGIDSVTSGLTTSTTSADTFETVAALLRAGGKRQQLASHAGMPVSQMPFTAPAGQPSNPFAAALSGTKAPGGGALNPPNVSMTNEFKG